MENVLTYLVAPIVSGLMGWFASAYRNRQRKEADQIEVARQYKELLADALEDKRTLYAEIDKLRDELRAVRDEMALGKEERTRMWLALAKATKCDHAAGCPVIRDFQLKTIQK